MGLKAGGHSHGQELLPSSSRHWSPQGTVPGCPRDVPPSQQGKHRPALSPGAAKEPLHTWELQLMLPCPSSHPGWPKSPVPTWEGVMGPHSQFPSSPEEELSSSPQTLPIPHLQTLLSQPGLNAHSKAEVLPFSFLLFSTFFPSSKCLWPSQQEMILGREAWPWRLGKGPFQLSSLTLGQLPHLPSPGKQFRASPRGLSSSPEVLQSQQAPRTCRRNPSRAVPGPPGRVSRQKAALVSQAALGSQPSPSRSSQAWMGAQAGLGMPMSRNSQHTVLDSPHSLTYPSGIAGHFSFHETQQNSAFCAASLQILDKFFFFFSGG